jgi:hypothetical protein
MINNLCKSEYNKKQLSAFCFLPWVIERSRNTAFCFLLSAFCLLLSCNNQAPTGVIQTSFDKTEESDPFILGNQRLLEIEDENIEIFLMRYKWQLKQTNTGLRYEITRKGAGKNFEVGEQVTFEYRLYLLTGAELYNSKQDGVKQFMVDNTEEIAGLHEAVKLMNKGTKARLIIPAHLAYGATGDGYKIMPFQTVMMKIEIV